MKLRIALALLALAVLPVHGGDFVSGSAKDALEPSAKSAKDLLPSPKSAKDLLPSAKSAHGASIPSPSRHRWVLGAGVSWRNIGEIDFDTGVTNLTLPMLFGNSSFTAPAGIGPATGFANRAYDDGFVNPDTRTPGIGRTTDYGYTTPSQIQGNSLAYTAAGGERRQVTNNSATNPADWSEDRDWHLSPYLKLSRLTELGNGWSAGPAVHFSFANLDGSRRGLGTLTGREQRDIFDVNAVDTYDATGLVLPLAPYTGAPDIVAPLLPAEPSSRTFPETPRSTDTAVWNDSVSESLDVDLWGISLGGEAVYQFQNKVFASVGAGVVLNIADWEAKRRDTLFQQVNGGTPAAIGSSSAKRSGTDLLWGLYLQAAAGYQVSSQLSFETHLRYDLNQSLSDSVGNSSFDVDLSGFSLGVGGNYTFW